LEFVYLRHVVYYLISSVCLAKPAIRNGKQEYILGPHPPDGLVTTEEYAPRDRVEVSTQTDRVGLANRTRERSGVAFV
jgi:hypothetical protein